jgi:hypothetical protein
MATPPSFADIMTNILNAVAGVIGAIATALAENASVIGLVIVVGALAFMVMRFGSRIFRGVTDWFRGLL